MNPFTKLPIYFLVPGDINRLTGGYAYDRRLLHELNQLGLAVQLVELAESFPNPDEYALVDANSKFVDFPDGAIVIVDGLAFGVLDRLAEQHAQRLRLIALCHHPLALEAGLNVQQQDAFRISETRALAASRAVLVTSENTARILVQDFSVDTNKIVVAVPGTDQHNFAKCEGQPPVLLTVATLTRRKAHNVLIEALTQLTHLPWQARFVGGENFDAEWALYLRNKVIETSLENRIQFLGSLDDVSNEYMQADIFVLPSLFEGYGMAFAEALSFGLPIVAADIDALESLIPASAGILVPPANANILATSLTQLLSDPTKRRQLQLGAQSAAQNLSSWTKSAEIVAKAIKQVTIQK
ncbi:MAG: glycosyltransferase family 4 protein [Cellvibrio sp.]